MLYCQPPELDSLRVTSSDPGVVLHIPCALAPCNKQLPEHGTCSHNVPTWNPTSSGLLAPASRRRLRFGLKLRRRWLPFHCNAQLQSYQDANGFVLILLPFFPQA